MTSSRLAALPLRRLLLGAFALLLLYIAIGWEPAAPENLIVTSDLHTRRETLTREDSKPSNLFSETRRIETIVAPQANEPNGDPRLRENALLLLQLAEAGNSQAQWKLGWYFLNGWGVDRDRCSATAWFEAAARQGEPAAQFRLALALLPPNGQGVAPDPEAAYRWASAARANGHSLSDQMFERLFIRAMTPEQRTAAERSLDSWTPATSPSLAIERYPYVPLLVGLWPRLSDDVMPCRQPRAPYEDLAE